jgi:putative PIN family toxin of toxin-antitoxin system
VIIVLDTNVLFAALISQRGLCARLFETCLIRHRIVVSQHVLDELRRHLSAKAKFTDEQVEAAIAAIAGAGETVEPADVTSDICRDPNDLPVIGTAIAGNAEILVTGDQDLLSIGEHAGIRMLSPRAFYDKFVDESGASAR